MTLKKVEDTHLGEEASRHWREIEEQSYLFDRHQKEVNHFIKNSQKNIHISIFITQYIAPLYQKKIVVVYQYNGIIMLPIASSTDIFFYFSLIKSTSPN